MTPQMSSIAQPQEGPRLDHNPRLYFIHHRRRVSCGSSLLLIYSNILNIIVVIEDILLLLTEILLGLFIVGRCCYNIIIWY